MMTMKRNIRPPVDPLTVFAPPVDALMAAAMKSGARSWATRPVVNRDTVAQVRAAERTSSKDAAVVTRTEWVCSPTSPQTKPACVVDNAVQPSPHPLKPSSGFRPFKRLKQMISQPRSAAHSRMPTAAQGDKIIPRRHEERHSDPLTATMVQPSSASLPPHSPPSAPVTGPPVKETVAEVPFQPPEPSDSRPDDMSHLPSPSLPPVDGPPADSGNVEGQDDNQRRDGEEHEWPMEGARLVDRHTVAEVPAVERMSSEDAAVVTPANWVYSPGSPSVGCLTSHASPLPTNSSCVTNSVEDTRQPSSRPPPLPTKSARRYLKLPMVRFTRKQEKIDKKKESHKLATASADQSSSMPVIVRQAGDKEGDAVPPPAYESPPAIVCSLTSAAQGHKGIPRDHEERRPEPLTATMIQPSSASLPPSPPPPAPATSPPVKETVAEVPFQPPEPCDSRPADAAQLPSPSFPPADEPPVVSGNVEGQDDNQHEGGQGAERARVVDRHTVANVPPAERTPSKDAVVVTPADWVYSPGSPSVGCLTSHGSPLPSNSACASIDDNNARQSSSRLPPLPNKPARRYLKLPAVPFTRKQRRTGKEKEKEKGSFELATASEDQSSLSPVIVRQAGNKEDYAMPSPPYESPPAIARALTPAAQDYSNIPRGHEEQLPEPLAATMIQPSSAFSTPPPPAPATSPPVKETVAEVPFQPLEPCDSRPADVSQLPGPSLPPTDALQGQEEKQRLSRQRTLLQLSAEMSCEEAEEMLPFIEEEAARRGMDMDHYVAAVKQQEAAAAKSQKENKTGPREVSSMPAESFPSWLETASLFFSSMISPFSTFQGFSGVLAAGDGRGTRRRDVRQPSPRRSRHYVDADRSNFDERGFPWPGVTPRDIFPHRRTPPANKPLDETMPDNVSLFSSLPDNDEEAASGEPRRTRVFPVAVQMELRRGFYGAGVGLNVGSRSISGSQSDPDEWVPSIIEGDEERSSSSSIN
ncbi:unnamed protein product [Vitrella brassicaformis CCMP3155]|uniref:Uncharacterized protein n=1 Tax=Vitrella brassicaformis (strain CCMP3155) TaxID=1169540 RepID=A0A0G4EBM9_VITBC|nr:unnamed protein product [Vitrella brassicaformis CCMP3155]|eukprot:CEL92935.1 unnamed protein product [Vitrella brassicaformis CCMP3155]